jgi:hypothetical protein
MTNPMPSPKTKTTKWILLAAVVGLVLCVVIVRLQSVGGARHTEGENNPNPAKSQRNETRRDSESGGPLVISSASVPPSSGSAPETAKWDGFSSLAQFQSAYADLLSAREGRELERLSCLLIGSASRVLSLDDMETFALEFKDPGSIATAMYFVGEKAAKELDWPAKVKWLHDRSGDPAYQGAFGWIGSTATPEQVPELLAVAGKISDSFLSAALLRGVFGTGNVESIKLVVDAFNKGRIKTSMGNFFADAPSSLAASGRTDEALEICAMIADEAGRSGAYRGIVMGSVLNSPSKAAAIVERIPNEKDRAAVVDALVQGWASSNLEEASKWVSNLAPGIVRDKAAAEVARSVLILNPQDALTWANSIGADALRTRTVSKVMDHLKITNPSLWEQVSKER